MDTDWTGGNGKRTSEFSRPRTSSFFFRLETWSLLYVPILEGSIRISNCSAFIFFFRVGYGSRSKVGRKGTTCKWPAGTSITCAVMTVRSPQTTTICLPRSATVPKTNTTSFMPSLLSSFFLLRFPKLKKKVILFLCKVKYRSLEDQRLTAEGNKVVQTVR